MNRRGSLTCILGERQDAPLGLGHPEFEGRRMPRGVGSDSAEVEHVGIFAWFCPNCSIVSG